MKNILIIEDDALKTKLLRDHLRSILPNFHVRNETSYNNGIRALKEKEYDLLILDMSMPTFSNDFFDSENSFEKFGGLMILKEIKRKSKVPPTILFTMFDDFGSRDNSISLKDVDETLRILYEDKYLGSVFFDSDSNNWKSDINKILHGKNFNN